MALLRSPVSIVLLFAAATGCSGSSGSGTSAPVPADDSFQVARNSSVTLSGLLDNDTHPDGDTLVLVSVRAPQKGSLVDNGGGSFTYTAGTNSFGVDSFTYIVADSGGDQAAGTINVTITPGWGAAQAINSTSPNALQSYMTVQDGSGNVTATWLQRDGGGIDNMWVNRFSVQAGWGTPTRLDTVAGAAVSGNQIIADAVGDGAVTAVWAQDQLGVSRIWSSRWTDGAWSTAETISDSGIASQPVMAIDGLGRVTVLYQQNDGGLVNLYAQHFVPNTGWATPEAIDDSVQPVTEYRCKTDQAGNVTAVFLHDAGVADMWANHCTPGTGWGTARKVELDDSGPAQLASIHPDPDGNVTLLWRQEDATRANAYSTRFTLQGSNWVNGNPIENQSGGVAMNSPIGVVDSTGRVTAIMVIDVAGTNRLFYNQDPGTGTWAGAVQLDTGVGEVVAVTAKVDALDNVHVVWTQQGVTHSDVWSSVYIPATGWSAPEVIDSEDLGGVWGPQLGVDDDGNAIATWIQSDGTANLWSNRYVRGVGWGQAVRVETGAEMVVVQGTLAVNGNGDAVVDWLQDVATAERLFGARYTAGVGWGPVVELNEGIAGNADTTLTAFDEDGQATVVWKQGTALYSIDFR